MRPTKSRAPWLLATAALSLSGCAAMEQARQKQIDESISVTAGTQLGAFRRVGLERIECAGKPCTPDMEASITREVSRSLTDACYGVVEADRFSRYADYFARRMEGSGRRLVVRGPAGGMIQFTRIEPELRDLLVEELQLDAVVSGTVEIGEPDSVTQFRPVTLDLKMVNAHSQETVWHSRMPGNILGADSMSQDLANVVHAASEGIKRKASICNLPPPPPPGTGDIEVVQQEIRVKEKVFFEIDSDQLSQRSLRILDALAMFLQNHPEFQKVRIEGHTDDVGDDGYNLDLSTRRAKSVLVYLSGHGVDAARLESAGYGETKPLVPNTSELNRARNRRVEFRIVSAAR